MQKQNNIEINKSYFDELKSDYERLFSSDLGKRVLKDICNSGYIDRSTYISGDINSTLINEGKRVFALHIKYMATPITKEVKQEQAKK